MKALLIREWLVVVRTGGSCSLGVVFFLLVVTFLPFSAGPGQEGLTHLGPGLIWIAALLSCLLALDRQFALDLAEGTLHALAVSPVALETVVIVKFIAHWTAACFPVILASPFAGMMLGQSPASCVVIALSLLAGTPAISAIGVFGAALTSQARNGGYLLPVLVLPMCIPTLILGALAADLGQAELFRFHFSLLTAVTLASLALLPFATARLVRGLLE